MADFLLVKYYFLVVGDLKFALLYIFNLFPI